MIELRSKSRYEKKTISHGINKTARTSNNQPPASRTEQLNNQPSALGTKQEEHDTVTESRTEDASPRATTIEKVNQTSNALTVGVGWMTLDSTQT